MFRLLSSSSQQRCKSFIAGYFFSNCLTTSQVVQLISSELDTLACHHTFPISHSVPCRKGRGKVKHLNSLIIEINIYILNGHCK